MRWGEVLVAAGCAERRGGPGHPARHRDRGRAVHHRAAGPAVPPARGDLRLRAGMAGMHDVDDYPDAEQIPGLVVSGTTRRVLRQRQRLLRPVLEAAGARLSLHHPYLEANIEVDSTGLDALIELHEALPTSSASGERGRGEERPDGADAALGVIDVIGEENVSHAAHGGGGPRSGPRRRPTPGRGQPAERSGGSRAGSRAATDRAGRSRSPPLSGRTAGQGHLGSRVHGG